MFIFIAIVSGVVIFAVLTVLARQFFGKSKDLYEESDDFENEAEIEFQNVETTEISLNESAILKPNRRTVLQFPYNLQPSLFSGPESRFFHVLRETLKDEYEIFTKVHAVDVFYVDAEERNFYVYFNRIARRHFDFVICAKDFSIIAVVEFAAFRNQTQSREESDSRMDEICRIANLPFIKFAAKEDYSAEEIREKLSAALNQAR